MPNNLVPYITKVLTGKLERLHVFGDDFDTEDGTGVRDYIHVEDLSLGHLKAYEFLKHHSGVNVWNLGTGIGHSVFDVVRAFERVTGRSIPYEISARREGDIARCWANPSKALLDLEWKAERTLDDMVRDAWRWAQYNLN
ncbi:UDP-glucose 4-epimerase [compost metagenome]